MYFAAFDPQLKLPKTYQWNAAVEQSLGTNQSVSLTYVDSAGRHLLRQEDFANLNSIFASLFLTTNSAKSDYNAMQAQYQRRLSHGLESLVAYTFAHSIDNASSPNTGAFPEPQYNPQRDRGPSNFDVRHVFAGSVSYSIPKLPQVPPTRAGRVKETIHGVKITDPYRWLENQDSPETRAWIAAQTKYTQSILSQASSS